MDVIDEETEEITDTLVCNAIMLIVREQHLKQKLRDGDATAKNAAVNNKCLIEVLMEEDMHYTKVWWWCASPTRLCSSISRATRSRLFGATRSRRWAAW